MNRRGFFGLLASGAAAKAIDVEATAPKSEALERLHPLCPQCARELPWLEIQIGEDKIEKLRFDSLSSETILVWASSGMLQPRSLSTTWVTVPRFASAPPDLQLVAVTCGCGWIGSARFWKAQ